MIGDGAQPEATPSAQERSAAVATPPSSIPTRDSARAPSRPAAFSAYPPLSSALYPDLYVWYVFVSALDIMLTVTVLVHLGMREANTFAQWSIDQFGTWGLIGLKFLSVFLVVLICEYIGRSDRARGRNLATLAILISILPITAALLQVAYLAIWGEIHWEE